MLVDVSRAHFYADAVRDVFIELPRDDPRAGDGVSCGRLRKTMYGTLDAAEQWGLHYAQTLKQAGFVQGVASPCHFFHPQKDIWVVAHGDDFFAVARSAGRRNFEDVMRRVYAIKVAFAGPAPDDPKELLPGRILTYHTGGVTLEGDPWHHEAVVQQLGLTAA